MWRARACRPFMPGIIRGASGPCGTFGAYGAQPEAPEQGGQVQEWPSYCKLAQASADVSGEAMWYRRFRVAH